MVAKSRSFFSPLLSSSSASLTLSSFPSRAQTTILCTTALIRMDESFLLQTYDEAGFDETIVDRAMEWLNVTVRASQWLTHTHAAPLF